MNTEKTEKLIKVIIYIRKFHPLFLNNFEGLKDIIRGRLNKMFSNTNHQLINLDNGGYRAGYDGTFSLLK